MSVFVISLIDTASYCGEGGYNAKSEATLRGNQKGEEISPNYTASKIAGESKNDLIMS
jgi:hypothetical protein